MTLLEIVCGHATATPDAPFITTIASDRTVPYAELADLAGRLRVIVRDETGVGDRIVLAAVNHWIFHPLVLACAEEGRVLVPLNPELHEDEFAYIMSDATPKLVIVDGESGLGDRFPGVATRSIEELIDEAARLPGPALAGRENQPSTTDPALFVYTSGTTGSGKAVMLTTENLVSMAEAFIERYEIQQDDRFLCVLPLYHMNGIMVTGILPMVAGASTYLASVFGFSNAKFYWDTVAKHRVSIPSLVPSIMAMLLKLFPEGSKTPPHSVRLAFCGTAPLPAQQWKDFEERFGLPVFQGYGLTETTTWVTSTPFDPDHRHDTVGVPFGAEVSIDARSAVPTGREEGEILVKGPMVMPGYFNQAKVTRESFRKGFLKTGDVGYFDEDGELHVTGRKKEIVIRNGVNINPLEIDAVVQRHEDIVECKTIGVRHEIFGEAVSTVCVTTAGSSLSATHVKDWVRERMSVFYVPDQVVMMPYLPKGPTGKVAAQVLRGVVSGDTAERTFKKLSARKYKRAKTADGAAIREIINDSYLRGAPIPMLMYWGCGARDSREAIDEQCLDRVADYFRSAHIIPASPMRLTLMLNDVHSTVNAIPESHYQRYYSGIREYADDLGFTVVSQKAVWQRLGLDVDEVVAEASGPGFDERWDVFPLREQLTSQAARHFRGGSAETGARRYALACLVEGTAFAQQFAGNVFLTYNGPDMDACLPALPKLYLYSYKKGKTVKPWFS